MHPVRVAALFVDPSGPYFGRTNVDPWDESRDARVYSGPHPVVAHPPCARWGCFWSMGGNKFGDDGGCFRSALASLRAWGGVLEHPASTRAWGFHRMPRPVPGMWTRSLLGPEWVTVVHQRNYGHRALKGTWLAYVGNQPPPPLNWAEPEPQDTMVMNMGHRERRLTPPLFVDTLIDLARLSASAR